VQITECSQQDRRFFIDQFFLEKNLKVNLNRNSSHAMTPLAIAILAALASPHVSAQQAAILEPVIVRPFE
jgi:hypothetical protein